MAKPSWWPYCWDAWRAKKPLDGWVFRGLFFFLGGGWFNRKRPPSFFLLKEKIISNFYSQKCRCFTWVIFWSPKKNGPKRAFIRLVEALELVQRFLLFAGGQVDLFKMIRKLMWKGIQDDSRCIFSILLCSCDPTGEQSKSELKRSIYNSALSSSS